MRVLYIVGNLYEESGGPTKVVRELSETLVNMGLEITIFSTIEERGTKTISYPKGVNLRFFNTGVLSKWWACYSPDLSKALEREISNYNLVHIHEIWHHPHLAAYLACRRVQKPYILTVHGALDEWCLSFKPIRKRIFSSLFERRILQEASAIHALTAEEVNNIRAFGIDNLVTMIPNGIYPIEFENLPPRKDFERIYPILEGKQVCLFLGRIHPKKGLDLFVKAFGKVAKRKDNVYMIIVGPDEKGYKREVEKFAEAESVLEKVIFTGMLTGKEKLAALSRADLFIQPSYSEGFSMAVLEALICGIPVIITKQCNFPEVAIRNAGRIINPQLDELVKALEELLGSADLRKEIGLNGKNLILEKFTWNKIGEEMIKLYEQILMKDKN